MSGYIQIDFNGEKVGLKFGYPAIKEFFLAMGKNVELYYEGEELTLFGMAKLIHSAYKNNCLLKEVEPSLTLENVSDWLEEILLNPEKKEETEVLKSVMKTFMDSRYVATVVKTIEESTVKKKKQKKITST